MAVTVDSVPVAVSVLPLAGNIGDSTLVFEVDASFPRSPNDRVVVVRVEGVAVNGASQVAIEWMTTVFDANPSGEKGL